jgi:hypothetical protein
MAALPTRKYPLVPTEQEADPLKLGWILQSTEKSLDPAEK